MSGAAAAKQVNKSPTARPLSGINREAAQKPITKEIITSAITIIVLRLVTRPYFLSSVFRCGFQCGTFSNTKWLPKANGIEIKGLGIFVAIAAPIVTCGVSSTVITMIYLPKALCQR